jgi:opacity protein-like surface antigen
MKPAIFAVVVTVLFGSLSSLEAQRLSVGVIGGGQGIPAVESKQLSAYALKDDLSNRSVFGPTMELRLPFHFSLEADVLYRQISGHAEACIECSANQFRIHYRNEDVQGHSWELAALAKKYIKGVGGFRPFGTIGLSERFTSGESQILTRDCVGLGCSTSTFSGTETAQSRKSTGALVGFGAEAAIKRRLLISPQLRYARWSNRPFSQFGFVSNRNSLDVLLSIGILTR